MCSKHLLTAHSSGSVSKGAYGLRVRQNLCRNCANKDLACNYYDTELNITVRLPVAQSRTDGLSEHYCERVHELPARIQYYTRITPESRAKLIASKGIGLIVCIF